MPCDTMAERRAAEQVERHLRCLLFRTASWRYWPLHSPLVVVFGVGKEDGSGVSSHFGVVEIVSFRKKAGRGIFRRHTQPPLIAIRASSGPWTRHGSRPSTKSNHDIESRYFTRTFCWCSHHWSLWDYPSRYCRLFFTREITYTPQLSSEI